MTKNSTPRPNPAVIDARTPTAAEPTHLETELAELAVGDEPLEVTYRRIDSPHGPLLIAATDAGVVRLTFADRDVDDVLTELADAIGPRILESPLRTDEAARQLDEYFTGRRRDFDLPVDLRLSHGFRRQVVDRLIDIPYGATMTYGELAEAIGNPGAVRAVGTACATNPIPVIIPCHRIVRSDGSMGNYLGGTDMKRALLTMEAA